MLTGTSISSYLFDSNIQPHHIQSSGVSISEYQHRVCWPVASVVQVIVFTLHGYVHGDKVRKSTVNTTDGLEPRNM